MSEKFLGMRGIIFSADALIASVMILLMLFTAASAIEARAGSAAVRGENVKLVAFAESVAEALVKNRNVANPMLGAAAYDAAKARVQGNAIDETLLLAAKPIGFNGYSISGLYERGSGGGKKYFGAIKDGCAVVERFVIIKGVPERKALLGVVVCAE